MVAVFELGAGFVNTFREFLSLRSLFGIAMGGIWGLSASTALENLPVEARGLASGILQQVSAFYLSRCISDFDASHFRVMQWGTSSLQLLI